MTSMPASRSARAMIFAPRSWPSRPGLATTTRILRVWVLFTTARKLMPTRIVQPRHGGAGLLAGDAAVGRIGRVVAPPGDRAPGRRADAQPPRVRRAPDGADDRRAGRRPRPPDRQLVADRARAALARAPGLRGHRPVGLPARRVGPARHRGAGRARRGAAGDDRHRLLGAAVGGAQAEREPGAP